jgi:hypothetical protein
MKMSKQQKIRMYSHYDPHLDEEDDFWPIVCILLTIIGLWTGAVHLIDYWTMDSIPWWAEPFTIVPVIFVIIMKERFDSLNPLHWWPMFWGYNVKLPSREVITIRPLDQERIMNQYGGMRNVHIIDYETLRFRKSKDAVIFNLRNG